MILIRSLLKDADRKTARKENNDDIFVPGVLSGLAMSIQAQYDDVVKGWNVANESAANEAAAGRKYIPTPAKMTLPLYMVEVNSAESDWVEYGKELKKFSDTIINGSKNGTSLSNYAFSSGPVAVFHLRPESARSVSLKPRLVAAGIFKNVDCKVKLGPLGEKVMTLSLAVQDFRLDEDFLKEIDRDRMKADFKFELKRKARADGKRKEKPNVTNKPDSRRI